MFFRMPRFIRRYIRNRMHPMAEHKAIDMKSKISMFYAFVAWNAGGYCIYQIYKGNKSWPKTAGIGNDEEITVRPAIAWAHALGVEKASVIHISKNFRISDKEEFTVDIESPTPNKYTMVEAKST